MASFSKNASRVVLPLTLALAGAGCVVQSAEDPRLGAVAEADTPTGTTTEATAQCNVDGGVNAYLSSEVAGYLASVPYGGGYLGYGSYGGYPSYGGYLGYSGYGGYGGYPSYSGYGGYPGYGSYGGYPTYGAAYPGWETGYAGYGGYPGLGWGGYYGAAEPLGAASLADAGIFIPCP